MVNDSLSCDVLIKLFQCNSAFLVLKAVFELLHDALWDEPDLVQDESTGSAGVRVCACVCGTFTHRTSNTPLSQT